MTFKIGDKVITDEGKEGVIMDLSGVGFVDSPNDSSYCVRLDNKIEYWLEEGLRLVDTEYRIDTEYRKLRRGDVVYVKAIVRDSDEDSEGDITVNLASYGRNAEENESCSDGVYVNAKSVFTLDELMEGINDRD